MRQTYIVHKIVNKDYEVVNKFNLIGTEVEVLLGKYEVRLDTVGGTVHLKPNKVFSQGEKMRIYCADYNYHLRKVTTKGGNYYE